MMLSSNEVISDRFYLFSRSKIEYSFDGPTIVYCPTKKTTETVARELQGKRKDLKTVV